MDTIKEFMPDYIKRLPSHMVRHERPVCSMFYGLKRVKFVQIACLLDRLWDTSA